MSSATSELNSRSRDEIVRAGAGAGKTYTLTHRVMDLADLHLREHDCLPRVVVTTFTRKATQELRERLMLLAIEERPHLVDFVNSRAYLVVSTIHGIMDLFLKRYGSKVNIDPAYQMIDGSAAQKVARQILRQIVLADGARNELLETFSFNTLVSLVRQIDQLQLERPDTQPFSRADFAALFSRRAEELVRHLRDVASRITAETDKPNWLEIADSCRRMASLLSGGDWLEKRKQFVELREAMPVARRSGKGASPVSETTIDLAKEARELAGDLLEPIFDPLVWELFSNRYQELDHLAREFSREFRRFKTESGKLEISDLEHLAMNCLREHPETAQAFAAEWDFWLIDEYQDTSPFQVELLRHLVGDRSSFIVGDPQQSIYLFRGARSEVFAEREQLVSQAGGNLRQLVVNRRSRPELLLFFNDFFSRLTPPFQPMEPFFKDGQTLEPSRVVAKIFIGAEISGTATESDEQVEPSSVPTGAVPEITPEESELRAIVAHIQGLLRDPAVHPEDICVLARTNQVLTQVAEHLNRAGLPTHVHAASGFFDRREIRDALALLKFLVNPHDNFNTIELMRSPWFRVSDQTLSQATSGRPTSLWEELGGQVTDSPPEELNAVVRLAKLLALAHEESLSEAFTKGMIDAGFVDLAHLHDVSGRREANVWKLLARLQVEERKAGFNPLAFVSGSRMELKMDESQGEGDAVAAVEPNRINLMTVHASKGLEFKHVILPKMAQRPRLTTNESFTFDEQAGRWAARVPYGDDQQMTASLPEVMWLERFREQELAEHARVLYVALTRASESVFLSWSGEVHRDSWAACVRCNLDSGLHNEASYTYLVERAAEAPASESRAVEVSTNGVSPALRLRWHEPLTEKSAPTSMSVSELIDQKESSSATPTRKEGAANGAVVELLKLASHGTAVHKLMEMLKYPSRERLESLIKKWFPGDEERVLDAVNFVRDAKNPPLLDIIMNGEVEKGFSFIEEGMLIEGQIDLWGRTSAGEAWIIDYKSGSPAHREKAFRQMGIYALALRRSGWLAEHESLKLAAVYPFSQKIFTVEEPQPEVVRAWLKERK